MNATPSYVSHAPYQINYIPVMEEIIIFTSNIYYVQYRNVVNPYYFYMETNN